jgi:hypothetical protein
MQTIRSVGVLSVAKIMGAIYFVLGLLFVPFFLFVGAMTSMAGAHNSPFAALGAISGIAMAVIVPIFYGVMGFVFGAIGALLYNLFAAWVGGIRINLQSTQTASAVSAG